MEWLQVKRPKEVVLVEVIPMPYNSEADKCLVYQDTQVGQTAYRVSLMSYNDGPVKVSVQTLFVQKKTGEVRTGKVTRMEPEVFLAVAQLLPGLQHAVAQRAAASTPPMQTIPLALAQQMGWQ